MKKLFQKKLKKVLTNSRELSIITLVMLSNTKNNTTNYSPIVQPVEHLTVNQGVVGSSPTRGATWPVGQAVKTPPFHGGIGGSIPPPVTIPGA